MSPPRTIERASRAQEHGPTRLSRHAPEKSCSNWAVAAYDADQRQKGGGTSTSEGIGHRVAHAALTGVLAGSLTGCSIGHVIAGAPTAPRPDRGPVRVEVGYTDSFDVLPAGTCRGRGIFHGVEDGAPVTVFPISRPDASATTVLSVRYEHHQPRRRPHDDGQYCVAMFTFVPPEPSLSGYRAVLESAGGRSRLLLDFQPNPDQTFSAVVQSCTDEDAAADRPCGYN